MLSGGLIHPSFSGFATVWDILSNPGYRTAVI